MLKIACIVDDDVSVFELAVAAEVFGTDRVDRGVPRNDFRVVTPTPGPIRLAGGLSLPVMVDEGLGFADEGRLIGTLLSDGHSVVLFTRTGKRVGSVSATSW